MPDFFSDKAADWDERPVPLQISEGVSRAILDTVPLDPSMRVLDFGAGTGLVCARIVPRVGRVLAVDVSPSMLAQLGAKPELQGKVEIHCRDILHDPLGEEVQLVVSAMAMHHVPDTAHLLRALYVHLVPGGRLALADLDSEDGSFHGAGVEGVFHHGFDREALRALVEASGFEEVSFDTACVVHRDGRDYPVFLLQARKPAA